MSGIDIEKMKPQLEKGFKILQPLFVKNNQLIEPFQYIGSHIKAYDETYDLSFEIDISSKTDSIKINKFPIIAYAYTDEGYKEIYQGINIVPVIKLDKNLEFDMKLRIS